MAFLLNSGGKTDRKDLLSQEECYVEGGNFSDLIDDRNLSDLSDASIAK